jgi:hypothetical protein
LYLVNHTLNLPLSSLDAYSNGEIFSLDMASLKTADATAIPWNAVQQPDLSTDTSGTITPGANTAGYQPVLALAQNHVQFLNVPGLPAGSAKIFVIHCMFSTLGLCFLNLKFSFCSLIHATRSATIRKVPNHIWKNSFFLPRYGCPTRVRVYPE